MKKILAFTVITLCHLNVYTMHNKKPKFNSVYIDKNWKIWVGEKAFKKHIANLKLTILPECRKEDTKLLKLYAQWHNAWVLKNHPFFKKK